MDRPWKKFERDIAAIFGTRRALMKGTGVIKDIGPEDDFPLLLDCKRRPRERWSVMAWFKKLEDQAGIEEFAKWPVLCLGEPGAKRSYAVVRQSALVKLILENEPLIDAERVMMRDCRERARRSIVPQWDHLMKSIKNKRRQKGNTLPEDLIPMLATYYPRQEMAVLVLRPTDLAEIFFTVGILERNEDENSP